MRAGRRCVWAAAALAGALAAGGASAQTLPPFYGYSDYFGGPTAYFTPDTDVQQVTRPDGGYFGFGTRTYYRGGPFWAYRQTRVIRTASVSKAHRSPRRRAVVRSKG